MFLSSVFVFALVVAVSGERTGAKAVASLPPSSRGESYQCSRDVVCL